MSVSWGRLALADWPDGFKSQLRHELQNSALYALQDVLSLQSKTVTPPSDKGPRLEALLPPKTEPDLRVQSAMGRMSDVFSVTDPPNWSRMQSRWLAISDTPSWWTTLFEGLARLFGRARYDDHHAASQMIDAIALDAWMSVSFRKEVALMLRAHLVDKVFLYPEPKFDARLSCPFWWVLLSGHLRKTFGEKPLKRHKNISDQLAAFAVAQSLSKGWAGFWELYLFRLCVRQAVPLPLRIRDWPIVARVSSDPPTDENDTTEQDDALRDWVAEKPGFAEQLLEERY